MFFYSAFLLGIFGSTHCITMCGPLVAAIPMDKKVKNQLLLTTLLYQIGRVMSYVILGLILGSIGWVTKLAGIQNMLSIGIGVLLIFSFFFSFSAQKKLFELRTINQLIVRFQSWISRYFTVNSKFSAIRLGLLNGFFPCGLVYLALAGAFVHFDTIEGAVYMFLFGIGTLPLMFLVMFLGQKSGRMWRKVTSLVPYLLLLFGILLVARGLSMEFPENPYLGNFKMCH